tara:strand:- start:1365 stop:1706 length:342 start_codon:yes stop_codon:yes gene_type:complete
MFRYEFKVTVGYLNPKSNQYVCTDFLISEDCYADALLMANMMFDVMKAYEMLPTAHIDDAILHVERAKAIYYCDLNPNALVLLGDPVQGLLDVYAEEFGLFWYSQPFSIKPAA